MSGFPAVRPRRNRSSAGLRALVRETSLDAGHLVLPMFIHEGPGSKPIGAMPGVSRHDLPGLIAAAHEAHGLGIRAVALFPALDASRKDRLAQESVNDQGLLQRTVRALKRDLPELVVITDVAMDPYSTDGHDGLVEGDCIVNDATLPILAAMAVSQARAGADVVAPSDMMDGRIAAIRSALDQAGFTDVAICSYCAKYASGFYGPFREALDSAPKRGDKSTYQMDPANAREALRELAQDEAEGADWILVKPGLPYLDIIHRLRQATALPIAAYHVSGEYSMLKAAAAQGWLDYDRVLMESLIALRRAGADLIFTYGAVDAARRLRVG